MAAAASVKVMQNGTRKYVINVIGVWDTADETDTIIINRSTLTGPDGSSIPGFIRIDEITWMVSGDLEYVQLNWKDTSVEVIDYFQGQGYMDYRPYGGKIMSNAPVDDTEGDLQLTAVGGTTNSNYSFLINCSLKN